jgi:hypothetical protein
MPGRRFLLIVAVLMGLTALVASLAPQNSRVRGGAPESQRASPTPSSPSAPGDGTEATLERTISADGEPDRVVVTQGDLVQLEVASEEVDSVLLGGFEQIEPVAPASNARFNLLADEPGRYAIELLDSGRRVGTLVVRPAT